MFYLEELVLTLSTYYFGYCSVFETVYTPVLEQQQWSLHVRQCLQLIHTCSQSPATYSPELRIGYFCFWIYNGKIDQWEISKFYF